MGVFINFTSCQLDVAFPYGDFFPEVKKDPQTIKDIINEEETQFLKTLTRGRRLLESCVRKLKNTDTIPGSVAWKLYDTYGFPVDLTKLMCEEKNLKIEMEGYEAAKENAKMLSKGKKNVFDDLITLDVHAISDLQNRNVPTTNDLPKYQYSAGEKIDADYSFEACPAKILALRKGQKFVDSVCYEECGILLDQTCFYAEQGGQIYDQGSIVAVEDNEIRFSVENTQVHGGYVLHTGVLDGVFNVGDEVKLFIDEVILSSDADQRGSLVAPDRLRFDFTNKGAVSPEQLKNVEGIANELIKKNGVVYAKEVPLPIAKSIQGLRAVFDETYPDPVRVLSIGVPVENLISDPLGPNGTTTSVEFCGGTYGNFIIVASEEAIAKGIRRIVALTGPEATKVGQAVKNALNLEECISVIENEIKEGKIDPKSIVTKIVDLIEQISAASISYWKKDDMRNRLQKKKKQMDDMDRNQKAAIVKVVSDEAKSYIETNLNKSFLIKNFNAGSNTKALDAALKHVASLSPETAAIFFSVDSSDNKIICQSTVPKGAIAKGLKANEWVQKIAELVGGKGGGVAASARASGSRTDKLSEAMDIASEFAKLKLQN
ncbi:Alanine--tRNA ligase, cytoplasmic [Nymphon striatum]|nr:Alanine--tRNA ligase, cytoplasmic [Nymphon striatum]